MTWAGAMAQSDVQFTQYWAVPTYYNPAYTGQVDFIRIRGGARVCSGSASRTLPAVSWEPPTCR